MQRRISLTTVRLTRWCCARGGAKKQLARWGEERPPLRARVQLIYRDNQRCNASGVVTVRARNESRRRNSVVVIVGRQRENRQNRRRKFAADERREANGGLRNRSCNRCNSTLQPPPQRRQKQTHVRLRTAPHTSSPYTTTAAPETSVTRIPATQ